MIRHSNSLLISIVVHLLLLLGAYFAWSSYTQTQKTYREDRVCLQLNKMSFQKETKEAKRAQKPKPKEEPKPQIEKKPEPKIEPKVEKTAPEVVHKKLELKAPKPLAPDVGIKKESQEKVMKEVKIDKEVRVEKESKEKKEVLKTEPKKEKKSILEEKYSRDEYMKVNTSKIIELIRENLYYPLAARKRNIMGRVSIKFTLDCDAKISNIEIVDSSSNILSRAAIKTIQELDGKFPKPEQVVTLSLPIEYTLN